MPSEAEIEAAAREIWNDFHGRMGGEWPGKDSQLIVVIQCMATARAALSAAVRSEPVAWRYPVGDGEYDVTDDAAKAARLAELFDVQPLYTSPVQTREDGIREALEIVEAVRVSPQWSGKNADWICGAVRFELEGALLSQPEPKGDKA
jgi:hypothetical protein